MMLLVYIIALIVMSGGAIVAGFSFRLFLIEDVTRGLNDSLGLMAVPFGSLIIAAVGLVCALNAADKWLNR